MRDTYVRQALFLAVLAALFFLLISAMLIASAHGETAATGSGGPWVESTDRIATVAGVSSASTGSGQHGFATSGDSRASSGIAGRVQGLTGWKRHSPQRAAAPGSASFRNPFALDAVPFFGENGACSELAFSRGSALAFAHVRGLAGSVRDCRGWCGYSAAWSRRGHRRHHVRRQRSSRRHDETSFLVRYNRVEGLFLGARLNRERWYDLDYNVALWGEGGYGFSSKTWRYQLGLERLLRIERDVFFALGGEIHDLTASQDDWIIPEMENSLAAFFLKEDFHDYYRRQGFSGYLEQNLGSRLVLHAEYREDQMFNLPPEPERRIATNWSLFGGKKVFRPNPLIDEGKLRGVVGRVVLDTRDDEDAPDEGWYVRAQAEFYGGKVKSDYNFDRFILDVRRYQPLGYGENLDIRLRVGTSRAPLPRQFLFDLGGLSTLRGRRFKIYTGNRMVLANIEYRIRADSRVFSGFPLDVLGGMNLILFVDAGRAWFCDAPDRFDSGFRSLKWRDLKANVGIAITDHDGRVRLNIARATDSGGAPVIVTFRINRPF